MPLSATLESGQYTVRSHEGRFPSGVQRERRSCIPGLCCLWSIGSRAASATDPGLDVLSMYHTAWSGKDGAPSGVQAMAQSKAGLLWLGAHNGLYNFDGVRFSSVRRVNSTELPGGEVYSLLAPRAGGLWVSYLFGGASFLDDGKATNYSRAEGLPQGTITDFAEGAGR